jgi:transcriptional regulator with XRE-family HTH domain
VRTPTLSGLGQALRWLRDRRGRKQYQVAETAGITKGMLSAYETGRQRPSLETLEKILDTLGCDLNDLHNAIQIINGRPEGMRRRGEGVGAEEEGGTAPPPAGGSVGERLDVHRILGRRDALPPEEERALTEMLEGFHRFLRYLHDTLARSLRPDKPGPEKPNPDNPGLAPGDEGER